MNASNYSVCWNCHMEVMPNAMQCVHCGAALEEQTTPYAQAPQAEYREVQQEEVPPAQYQDPSAPYSQEASPFTLSKADWSEVVEEAAQANKNSEQQKIIASRFELKALLLLLPGSLFFVFSLMLLFFSQDGDLILQWDSGLWPYYFLSSLVLLFFGWRTLKVVDAPAEELLD